MCLLYVAQCQFTRIGAEGGNLASDSTPLLKE